jgi:hypothetical protein
MSLKKLQLRILGDIEDYNIQTSNFYFFGRSLL